MLKKCWQVKASPDEVNWPDLIVTEETSTIGLEVREIYLDETIGGSPKKALETQNRKQIANLAKDYYLQNKVPVKLNLLGCVGYPEELLQLLTDEVDKLSVWEQKRFEVGDRCVAFITRLPEEFNGYCRWISVSDRVGLVANIEQSRIESVIAKKAEKLEKYKKNISDVRLLIVSNRIYNSGKAQLMQNVQCHLFGFSSVYYISFPDVAYQIPSE